MPTKFFRTPSRLASWHSAFRIPHSAFTPPRLLFAFAALSLLTAPAFALFEVKDPLSKMYNVESKSVYAGMISAYDPDSHILTVKPFTVYKGATLPAEALRIEIKSPEALWSEIHVGKPIVLFQGPRAVAFHVADHWYAGQVLGKPNIFLITTRIGRPAHTSHDESFPGTTEELIHALDELKTGKSTLLDKFPDLKFPPAQKIATLPAHAIAFAACQLPSQKEPTFFVATAAGLQALIIKDKQSLQDVTAELHLAHLKPTRLAAVTYPKDAFLLVDNNVYVDFDLGHFAKVSSFTFPEKILAATPDYTAKPTLVFLTPHAVKRTDFPRESKAGDTPDALTSPDDDTRLTGTLLTDYHPQDAHGFTAGSLAAIDINHDGRPDLIILTPGGTLTLLNRGFGGFLVNKDDAAGLLDPAATGKPQLPLLASTPDTLWLLEKDGTLYRYNFPAK